MNERYEMTIRDNAQKTGQKTGESTFRRGGKSVREASRYHTLAVEIAFAVIAPALAGYWLDTKTGKGPWLTIAGFILGAAAAFRSVQRAYHESRRALQNDLDSRDSAGMESSE